jgi:hypothetical protein
LLGPVGIKLNAVAKHLSTTGDSLECHAIANAGVDYGRWSIWKLKEQANSLGFEQWQRVEAESAFALETHEWPPFSEAPDEVDVMSLCAKCALSNRRYIVPVLGCRHHMSGGARGVQMELPIIKLRMALFDPRNNMPRIGRVLIARGRDAADVAMVTTFGPYDLKSFQVWTYELEENMLVNPSSNSAIEV